MYCKNCGKQIDDDSKYCMFCGAIQNSKPIIDSVPELYCKNCGSIVSAKQEYCSECDELLTEFNTTKSLDELNSDKAIIPNNTNSPTPIVSESNSVLDLEDELKKVKKVAKSNSFWNIALTVISFVFYSAGVFILAEYFTILISFIVAGRYLYYFLDSFVFGSPVAFHNRLLIVAALFFISYLIRFKRKTLIYKRIMAWGIDGGLLVLLIIVFTYSYLPGTSTDISNVFETNRLAFELFRIRAFICFAFFWVYYPVGSALGGTIGKKMMNLKTVCNEKMKLLNYYLKVVLIGLPTFWQFFKLIHWNEIERVTFEYDLHNIVGKSVTYKVLLYGTAVLLIASSVILYFNKNGLTIQDWISKSRVEKQSNVSENQT